MFAPGGPESQVKAFVEDESGVGVVEIILILVVLISLVVIFKKQLTSLVTSILSKITEQSNSI
jgi:Flp pilus assembly pilin Flp